MDPRIDRYFRSYDKKTFHVVACQGNEPTEQDIEAFEKTLGFRLPEDFRAFALGPLGGLYVQVHEELWPRAKPYEVGPFWSFLRAIKVFGIATDIPGWLDIRVERARFAQQGWTDWVPFLGIEGSADRFCFDRQGRIVEWSHDVPDKPRPVEAAGFADVLMTELKALEERARRKLEAARKG
jgi:hypothetical protein